MVQFPISRLYVHVDLGHTDLGFQIHPPQKVVEARVVAEREYMVIVMVIVSLSSLCDYLFGCMLAFFKRMIKDTLQRLS